MELITTLQAMELIDLAAHENRLYHYNGGQAYIRLTDKSEVIMIIDHTCKEPSIEFCDGTEYFKEYKDIYIEHSYRIRKQGSMANWYRKNYMSQELDLV